MFATTRTLPVSRMKLNLSSSKRIALVGNVASGKTHLAQKISIKNQIPVTHVDAIQFNENLQINNLDQTRKILDQVQNQSSWIIDGHGPLDMLEKRFALADRIIFLDRPPYVNYLLLTYRHFKNIFWPRPEFYGKKSELTWQHMKKSYRTVDAIHKKMRPELIRMLNRPEFVSKVLVIKGLEYLRLSI